MNINCLPSIEQQLALQIQPKIARSKDDFVFIFVVILRSIGIQCRLVVNLVTLPTSSQDMSSSLQPLLDTQKLKCVRIRHQQLSSRSEEVVRAARNLILKREI